MTPTKDDPYAHWKRYYRLDKAHLAGRRLVIGYSSKCGSSTIRTLYRSIGALAKTEVQECDRVTLYMRHPYDRLVSGWKWFTARRDHMNSQLNFYPAACHLKGQKNISLLEWATVVLPHADPHWLPQTTVHPHWREYTLAHVSELGLVQEKKTEHGPWEDYWSPEIDDVVREYYAEDMIMWEAYKEARDGINTGTT